ncbi:unnamed protein product [Lota lota]
MVKTGDAGSDSFTVFFTSVLPRKCQGRYTAILRLDTFSQEKGRVLRSGCSWLAGTSKAQAPASAYRERLVERRGGGPGVLRALLPGGGGAYLQN